MITGPQARAARAILGLSQGQVGAAIGTSDRVIRNFETGQVDTRGRTIEALERFLSSRGVTWDDAGRVSGPAAAEGALRPLHL